MYFLESLEIAFPEHALNGLTSEYSIAVQVLTLRITKKKKKKKKKRGRGKRI